MKKLRLNEVLRVVLSRMLLMLLIAVVHIQCISAQAVQCFTESGAGNSIVKSIGGLPSSGCDNFAKYAPEIPEYMPIKNVRLIFHVIQKDDGSDNFQESSTTNVIFDDYLAQLNWMYSNLKVTNFIVPDCPPGDIVDSRIRFIKGAPIIFHQNTNLWCSGAQSSSDDLYDLYVTANPNLTQDLKEHAVHVFVVGCSGVVGGVGVFDNAGFSNGIPAESSKSFIVVGGAYHNTVTNPPPATPGNNYNPYADAVGGVSKLWAHELGHLMGLYHSSMVNDYCCDTDPEGLLVSDNMMAYWPHATRVLTACQLARIHYFLEGKCGSNGDCSVINQAVITDYCQKDDSYDVVIHSGEQVVWEVDRKFTTDIVIEPGAQLTIKCRIGLPNEANIIVKRGARLFVDGGTITHNKTMWWGCDEGQWGGILVYGNADVKQKIDMQREDYQLSTADDLPGFVILKNNGTIEYARQAIITGSKNIPWPALQDYWGGLVYAQDFTFRNNHRSAAFMKYEHPDFSAFVNCDFINDDGTADQGVTDWGANGLSFSNCRFTNLNEVGLITYDASASVLGCTFTNIHHGIEAFATSPVIGHLKIGGSGSGLDNLFDSNEVGIYAVGINKFEVINNTFDHNNFGLSINGVSEYLVQGNSFISSASAAIDLVQTGSDSNNKLDCNTYAGDFIGVDISGANRGMLFSKQDFGTSYDVFLSNEGDDSGKLTNQGSQFEAVWNYFTNYNIKDINTAGATEIFNYFYPDGSTNLRVKPDCALNDGCSALETENFYNTPAFGVETPCSDGGKPDDKIITEEFWLELKGEIARLNALPQLTEVETMQLVQSEMEARDVFNELLRRYHQAGNYNDMENLLLAENTKSAQRRLIGLKLELGDFAAAGTLLNEYPNVNNDDQYYKFTQRLNIDRLSQDYSLSVSEKETLHSIVDARVASSAYAKSLLALLAAETFEPEIPLVVQGYARPDEGAAHATKEEQVIQGEATITSGEILIYPNPAKAMVQLDFSGYKGKVDLEIYNSLGRSVYHYSGKPDHKRISSAQVGKGVFWVRVMQKGQLQTYSKFIILE